VERISCARSIVFAASWFAAPAVPTKMVGIDTGFSTRLWRDEISRAYKKNAHAPNWHELNVGIGDSAKISKVNFSLLKYRRGKNYFLYRLGPPHRSERQKQRRSAPNVMRHARPVTQLAMVFPSHTQ